MIRAVRTLDCAKRVRVHYLLPGPLARERLEVFVGADVSVDAFSRLVQGARDHVTVAVPGRYRAAGALGGDRLVATFGKTRGAFPGDVIASFERALGAAGFGAVLPHEVPPGSAGEEAV